MSFSSDFLYRQYHNLSKERFLNNSEADQAILEELTHDKASMVARFGSNEIKAALFPGVPKIVRPMIRNRIFNNMVTCAGFYPGNAKNIRRFSFMMHADSELVDILGSWRFEEWFLRNSLKRAKLVSLNRLEPYFQEIPWTQALENKKVLVIHPFADAIKNQYDTKRKLLFRDPRILPEFKSLETIKAVQSIAGNRQGFADWFAALEYMKAQIDRKDFDIAIIGCGAYGFPLAAHVKRIGKKGVHFRGATQILFGIKGKRWIENPSFKDILNEHFVFPQAEDRPEHASLVEGGCYW